MKRKVKKYKFGFCGYEILISLRYPVPRKKASYFQHSRSNLVGFKKYIKREIVGFNNFLLKHLVLIGLTTSIIIIYYLLSLFLLGSYYTKPVATINNITFILSATEKEIERPIKKINEQIVFNGPRDSKKVALTFDADMTPQMKIDLENGNVASYYDSYLIQTLKDTNTKATLFLTGMWIESYPLVAKELSSNALFELANHSYSHPGFDGECYGLTPITDTKDKEEIDKTKNLLEAITHKENRFFRFPGGCYSQIDLDELSKRDLVAIQWDAAAQDGFNDNQDLIIANVLTNVQNGSIIVMHMNGFPNEPQTANALPVIISELKNRGFIFVTLSELLDIKSKENLDIRDIINPYFRNTK